MTCTTDVCGTGGWTGPLPGDPDNNSILTATPAFGGIDVSWTYPAVNPEAVAHVLLYRGTSASYSSAILRATVGGNFFYDKSDAAVSTQYWYWIQIVSVNGTVGALIGPAHATAKPTIEQMIELLTGKIDAGSLAQSLKQEVDKITLNASDLSDEIYARVSASNALSQALAQVQNGTQQTLSLVSQEITHRQEGDSALAGQVNVVAAANNANLALITEESLARVAANTAMGLRVDGVSVVAGNAADAAAAANTELANIASDAILSPSEKPRVIQDYEAIIAEKSGIDAEATRYGIVTTKIAYDAMVVNLTNYLATLTGWNVVPGSNVAINPATFKDAFLQVYSWRQKLLNAISEKANTLIGTAQSVATKAAADISSSELAKAENASTYGAASAIAQKINDVRVAAGNAAAAIKTVESAKIGYSAYTNLNTGEIVPYDGNNSNIVYPEADYPAATYPEYAANRRRIIDKLGVQLWNSSIGPNDFRVQVTWYVGLPLASAIKTIQVSDASGGMSSLENAFYAQQTLNGEFKAQYTAKISVTDGTTKLIGGFGIYGSTGTGIIEAGFDVDKFWIGRTAANKRKPFIVTDGVVYIDDAVIRQLTFDKLRAADGSLIVADGKIQGNYLSVNQIDLVGTTNFNVKTAATGARMEMTSKVIKVFDANGTLRVKLGDLSA